MPTPTRLILATTTATIVALALALSTLPACGIGLGTGAEPYNCPGCLDYSFGEDGIAWVSAPSGPAIFNAVAMQNGSVVAAGAASSSGTNQMLFARFRYDGSIDTSFGGMGTVSFCAASVASQVYSNAPCIAWSLAVLPNGDLLAGGEGGPNSGGTGPNDPGVVKLNSSGFVDTAFGINGYRSIPPVSNNAAAGNERIASLLYRSSNGDVVGTGLSVSNTNVMDIFSPTFYPNNTYGETTSVFSTASDEQGNALAQIPNSSDYLVVGYRKGIDENFLACRTDGVTLNGTFGGGSCSTVDFGGIDIANAADVSSDGMVLYLGGVSRVGSVDRPAIAAMFTSSGGSFGGFGSNGQLLLPDPGVPSEVRAVVFDPKTSKILVVVSPRDSSGSVFVYRLYAGTGSLDLSFGPESRGFTKISLGSNARVNGAVITGDKLMIVGGANGSAYAARLHLQ